MSVRGTSHLCVGASPSPASLPAVLFALWSQPATNDMNSNVTLLVDIFSIHSS